MQELPFVTRFNLGNGLFFNREGKTENGLPWYNVGMQDWMPSWRWWITGRDEKVPDDAIHCDFVFEDAWFGGSCLKLHGATVYSKVRLFKTNLPVHEEVKLSFTYKVKMGEFGKLKLILSREGAEDQFIEVPVEGKNISQEWLTVTCKLGDFGWKENEHIACIGFVIEDTSDDFEMFIGELALTDPKMKYKPVKPEITKTKIIREYADSLDFKLVWNVIPWVNREKDMPVMNEAIDTWYFEVYVKDSPRAKPRLIATTTSWAAYVCGVPLSENSKDCWLGVRAISPDGKRSSKVAWSKVER